MIKLLEKLLDRFLKRPNHTRKNGSFVCRPIWIKYMINFVVVFFGLFFLLFFLVLVVYHKWNYTNAFLNWKSKCIASHMLCVHSLVMCARTRARLFARTLRYSLYLVKNQAHASAQKASKHSYTLHGKARFRWKKCLMVSRSSKSMHAWVILSSSSPPRRHCGRRHRLNGYNQQQNTKKEQQQQHTTFKLPSLWATFAFLFHVLIRCFLFFFHFPHIWNVKCSN